MPVFTDIERHHLEEALLVERKFVSVHTGGYDLELELINRGSASGPSVHAWDEDEVIAELNTQPMTYGDTDVFVVVDIEVDEGYRRSGVATRMYEAAAKLACSHKRPLASDVTRFAGPRAFWSKQVQKGRAREVPARGSTAYVLSCPAPSSLD